MSIDWENYVKCDKINKNRGKFTGFDSKKTRELLNSISDNKEHDFMEYTHSNIEKENLGIDANTDKKLKAGKIKIDRRVDFHGMKLDEAFDLLVDVINRGYECGLRCILFITGKGRGSVNGKDTIKKSIIYWLKSPEIVGKIIKYTEATQTDGGSGALYVLLRRKK